jgi:hypothetical protein
MNPPQQPFAHRLRALLALLLITALAAAGGGLLLAAPSAAQPEAPTLTWTQVHSAPGVYWYTVVFPTPSVGYALGGPDWNVNEGIGPATLAKTTDGGQHLDHHSPCPAPTASCAVWPASTPTAAG